MNAEKQMSNYDKAIASGIKSSFYPGQFNKLFPGASNVISYYSGAAGERRWASQIGLYGRCTFVMLFVPITFDRDAINIVSNGVPILELREIRKVTPRPNGGFNIEAGRVWSLPPSSWPQLMESRGDFRALGIILMTNSPVDGFVEASRGIY